MTDHVRGLVEALEKCRAQFRFYVDQHLAKSPPDYAKAETNRDFVRVCDAALTAYRQESGEAQKPEPAGIFRDHSCWKCSDGQRPCVARGGPNNCEYPHARND